ncbi:hypothetical protein ACP4OV_012440 [Aristida adscensionis]
MSSYPVLNNRPIDQWRVTDLKDELRKRRLPVKGLKEELVRRLFESIESEKEVDEAAEDVDVNAANDQQPEAEGIPLPDENVSQKTTVTVTEVRQETVFHVTQEAVVPQADVGQELTASTIKEAPSVDIEPSLNESTVGKEYESTAVENSSVQEVQPVLEKTSEVGTSETVIVNDVIGTDVKSDMTSPAAKPVGTDAGKFEEQDSTPEAVKSSPSDADPMDTDVAAAPLNSDTEKQTPKIDLGDSASVYDEELKDSKPMNDDCEPIVSKPNNQVPEVSPDLGSQIKHESISSDDISTNEKNNIKDNLNANNFDLELEDKPEMVKPSSGITSLGGDFQPLDDDKELVKNQSSLEDIDSTANVDSYKKDSPEGGSPEKLNLDRSSGDESMEEDVMEIKQDSNVRPDDLSGKAELSSEDVKDVSLTDSAVGSSPVETKGVIDEEKPLNSTEKRKLEAEEVVTNAEPIKRQRRWTADSAKVPERQPFSQAGSDAPKDVFQPALKRSFGRSDSTASADSPKERIVPPSQKPATPSLRIDKFVRPFTLKAVQELLGKTGSVCSFWMDHIKTHCYVTYSSVEEAVATRNAVYNLQWPTNNGNHLVAEFVDPQEVKLKLEPPPPPAAPISPAAAPRASPVQQAQTSQNAPRQAATPREQLPPPPPLAKPPTADPGSAKERLPLTPKKPEPPVVTLDDLFRKTQSSPRIYYLPLSEEEVAAKLAAQGKGKKD